VACTTAEILAELDTLLEPERFDDYCVNGLQVPGAQVVERIATGVSANAELFELAAREHANMLLVHHGLFWGAGVRSLDATLRRRLRLLFDADIALAAYHLPLDAHPEVGNNALLAQALGAQRSEPFARHGASTIGRLAALPGEGLTLEELIARTARATGSEPLALRAGPEPVRTVAIVSGAGADYLPAAAQAGAQALLTGEPEERSQALARELGVSLIAAGHHASETFGVRRVGELLAERLGLEHVFLDVPNPV
jgi:dinuclear metal center YbgI/SA1388 family protein